MFHMMPKVAGLSLLQDRVFHVLVVTANTYQKEAPSELCKSFTVQLPINYASFGDVKIVQESNEDARFFPMLPFPFQRGVWVNT